MEEPPRPEFTLSRLDRHPRPAATNGSFGLICTQTGLSLAGAPLLSKAGLEFAPRPADEIGALVKAAYGNEIDPARIARGLDLVARALSSGDLGRAMIAAIHLRLPPLGLAQARRVAAADEALTKYDPNEPRDQRGRWTTGGDANPRAVPKPEPAVARPLGKPHRPPLHRPARSRPVRPTPAPNKAPGRTVDSLPEVQFHRSALSPATQKRVSAAAVIALESNPIERLAWAAMERTFGMGDDANPGPGRLLYEWRTGSGPQTRVLGPASAFSREFAVAPSTADAVQRAIAKWKARPGGLAGKDQAYRITDLGPTFGPKAFVQDTQSPNAAAHVIGSFNLAGIIEDGEIHWRAVNDMGLNSFAAGHWSDKLKVPVITQNVDRPLPFGTTRQIILWDTDLGGRYIRQRGH